MPNSRSTLSIKPISSVRREANKNIKILIAGEGEETYLDGKLISFKSNTKQNKKEKFVNLKYNKKTKKFDIKGSSYTGEASSKYIIGNWWSHSILKATAQISPISGSIKEQVVQLVGKEDIELYGKKFFCFLVS